VELPARLCGLERDSVALLEQVRTIDKRRLKRHVSRLDEEVMAKVDEALAISMGLKPV
jgi:mRNA interferase MazF